MKNNVQHQDETSRIGGLTGGIYAIFEFIGRLFFTLLLGRKLSMRLKLQNHRIIFGGVILFSIIFTYIFIIKQTEWFIDGHNHSQPIIALITLGILIGGMLGFVVSILLLSYVKSIKKDMKKSNYFKKNIRRNLMN